MQGEIPLKEKVNLFLKEVKAKILIWDIIFRPRNKNTDTLLTLGITANQRKECILNLQVEDYYKGPSDDTHDHSKPEFYEFGIEINSIQVYIKLNKGMPNKSVDCMSFHIAERSINHPLK